MQELKYTFTSIFSVIYNSKKVDVNSGIHQQIKGYTKCGKNIPHYYGKEYYCSLEENL